MLQYLSPCPGPGGRWAFQDRWSSGLPHLSQRYASVVHGCVRIYVNIFKQPLLWIHWANWSQISCGTSMWWGNQNIYAQMGQVTWPMWLPCSYIVNTLTNLLLLNQKIDDFQTWYYQVCSTDDHGLTLTFLTARSCLVPYAFVKQLIFLKQL